MKTLMILKYLLMVWGGKTGTMKVLFLDKSLLCVQRHKALFEGHSYSSPAMSHAWKRWWAGFCCFFSLEIGHFLYSDIIQLEHINKHKYNLMAWTNWNKKLFWGLQLWKHYHKLFVSHLLRPLRYSSREEWVLLCMIFYRMNNYYYFYFLKQNTARGVRTGT